MQKISNIPHYAAHSQLLLQQTLSFFNFLMKKVNASFPDELRLSTLRELMR